MLYDAEDAKSENGMDIDVYIVPAETQRNGDNTLKTWARRSRSSRLPSTSCAGNTMDLRTEATMHALDCIDEKEDQDKHKCGKGELHDASLSARTLRQRRVFRPAHGSHNGDANAMAQEHKSRCGRIQRIHDELRGTPVMPSKLTFRPRRSCRTTACCTR